MESAAAITCRKAWGVIALALALLFGVMTAGHADAHPGAPDQGVAAASHYSGDDDGARDHHLPGSHCASHCAGHVATPPAAEPVAVAVPWAAPAYALASDGRPLGQDAEPLIRPPAA